jgi:outer membrane protein assembly complex protein YaeT
MIPHLLLAAILASSQEVTGNATESYRGRLIREVRLEHPAGPAPEASRELVELLPGERYHPEAVRRSIQQLFSLGLFSDIKVEAFPAGEAADEVAVVFRLFPRLEVANVEVVGIENAAELSNLRSRLLEVSRIRAGDPLEVEDLGPAAGRLAALLRTEGYLWAQVEPEAEFQSPQARILFHVNAGARARVSTVVVEGVAPHIEAHVRREVALDEGSLYSRSELDRKLASLTAEWKELGYYGAQVSVTETPLENRGVEVRIAASLGPRVNIEVSGWDFGEKELRKLVPLFSESRFTEDLVEESRVSLEQWLEERGHRDAVVSVERTALPDGSHLLLRFHVEAGPRYEVAAIEIQGLKTIPEADLRALFVTRSRRVVRSAPFRQSVWDADRKEVATYLESRGFHRARIDSEERLERDDSGTEGLLTLILRVEEGPRAMVDRIEMEGVEALDPGRVLESARLEPADPFAASSIVAARERILTLYRNEGFRGAEVESKSVLDESGESAFVSFVVREGERTRVDRVIFAGLRVTKESAVRRLVTLSPDAPLSPAAIAETRQNLVGSGLFRSVDIDPLPPDPETQKSDVLITLSEGPRTTFAYGFGYEERQLFRAEIEVTRRNLFGQNRSASIFARGSFRGGRFITTYRQPEVFGFQLPAFVSVYAEEEDRSSFDYNRVGVGLQLLKRLSPRQNLFFRYRFDQTKVFQLEVDIEEIDRRFRNTRVSAFSVASVTDDRDDPLNPGRGQFRILDLEWSARALGTEVPYLKGLAQQFFYLRLPRSMVAALGMRLGVGQSYGIELNPFLPITERFFAGGATTLRGFALDEASPKRQIPLPSGELVEGEPVGGNFLALLNLELRFPILGNLRGVIFSDNGNVYRRLEDVKLDWRHNMGFGFRYDTPLGPLRVDYGLKLDRRTVRSIDCPDLATPCRESLGRLHVSLGHAF